MIVIQHQPKRVEVTVYGEFALADYREFEEMVNSSVRFEGPQDLLFDLRQMADFTLDVAWEDLVFARSHPNDFNRIAVLTQSQWVAWSAWLTRIFVRAEMQVFDDEAEARRWLDQDGAGVVYSTLVSCATLAEHLDDPGWKVFDCRHQLADHGYGQRSYGEGHVPGAFFMDMERDLSGEKTGRNGRHPLPDPQVLAAKLGAAGVTAKTQVVVYDDAGGTIAGRLWWMLRWLGHERVALLDGGMPQWVREGRALETALPSAVPAMFESTLQGDWVVSVDQVVANLETHEFCVVDARGPDRFRGENETIDPVGGHIPGARNRFCKDNLTADGLFRPAPELRREFLALLAGVEPEQAVMQCGSGVTACHNLLAMEIAGLRGARLYPGSWSEWCSDPARPVAR